MLLAIRGPIVGEVDNLLKNVFYKNFSGDITFYEKKNGKDFNKYFVLSILGGPETFRASVSQDLTSARNETSIEQYDNGWIPICVRKFAGDTCSVGGYRT